MNELIDKQAIIDALVSDYAYAAANIVKDLPSIKTSDDCISKQTVKDEMLKYGFTAPDMTVHEFVEDVLPSVIPIENDCISRQEVLYLINSYGGIDYKARQDMLKIIQNKPSITPTERTGHWIRYKENCLYNKCSVCGKEHCREDNYCPNCGAKMV